MQSSGPSACNPRALQSDDDKKRLAGSGLVLADKAAPSGGDVDPGSFYLAARGGKLVLVDGGKVWWQRWRQCVVGAM
jgi:hypothetical protein